MADKITNDDRNSHKQIISNELDPVSGLQYDRYVLLNPELQKFNQETYDKMIDGTTDTFVFAEGEVPDTTPKPISEIGFVDKELFIDDVMSATMKLSDSGKVLYISNPTDVGYGENLLWDDLKGLGWRSWDEGDNVLHWSNHEDNGETVYYQPPLEVGKVLYKDEAMTQVIEPFFAESYYAIYEHARDWKLDKNSSEGGLREVYKTFFHDVQRHIATHGPANIYHNTWFDASPQTDVSKLGDVYAKIDNKFSGGFVKVGSGDGKVISLHHMGNGYSYGGGFLGRTWSGANYDLPTINTTPGY